MRARMFSKWRSCGALVRWSLCACLTALSAAAPLSAQAQTQSASADSVKAAFLYHFAGYVEWPGSDAQGPVTIGVMGSETVAAELQALLPGRNIDGRPVRVRNLSSGDDLSGLHVLFIGEHEHARARQILEAMKGAPTLTVTDAQDGLDRGAMISFVLVEDRVRFEISQAAAERTGLKLSSRLLAVALRIRSSGVMRRSPFATVVIALRA